MEESIDDTVPQGVMLVSLDQVQNRTVNQIAAVSGQQSQDIVEVIRLVPLFPKERIPEIIVEQTVEVSVRLIWERCVAVAKAIQ